MGLARLIGKLHGILIRMNDGGESPTPDEMAVISKDVEEAFREPVRIGTGTVPPPGYPIEATCARGCPSLDVHPLRQYKRYADRGYCTMNDHEIDDPKNHGCFDHPRWEGISEGAPGETGESEKKDG
jgi:hypothetical protein